MYFLCNQLQPCYNNKFKNKIKYRELSKVTKEKLSFISKLQQGLKRKTKEHKRQVLRERQKP